MKTVLTVIVTLLIAGGAFYAYQNFELVKKNNPENQAAQTQVSPTAIPSAVPTQEVAASPSAAMTSNGTITGTFNYPSEGMPDTLKACAEDSTTSKTYCSGTLAETGMQGTFSLEVPAGKYYVYATGGLDASYKAYYNEFVTCGLLATCPSHAKIVVTVKAGQPTTGIKPHDWYNN